MRTPTLLTCFAAIALTPSLWAAKDLQVFFVDVEGGQSTLIVTPAGESMLIDTGWPGHSGRDADRIVKAAKHAKLKRIDYVIITHYHDDHVGGAALLAERFPVGTFVDHGPNAETGKHAGEMMEIYEKALKGGAKRLTVKAGDTIPMKGVDVKVVASNGDHIDTALPGGGQPNGECASCPRKKDDTSENARSVGVVLTWNKFKLVDLGDLTWNKELDLVCPKNLLGTADVFVVSHHGMDLSNSPALVRAIHPRLAIMDNGARKGGSPSAWQVVKNSPGLEDLWQLHFAVGGGKDANVPDTMIANTDESCAGDSLHLVVEGDGSMTVNNSRNRYTKTYK